MHLRQLSVVLVAITGLVSCSATKKAGNSVGTFARSKVERLKNLKFPGQADSKVPPVVQVRRDDLRKVEPGREKALAWARYQGNAGAVTMIPADFDPDKLPVGGPLPATGILPPLSSGDPGSDAGDEKLSNLPELNDSDFEEGDEQ